MSMRLDFKKNKLAALLNLKKIGDWLATKIRFFVFALFIFLALGCLAVWYRYAYAPAWSEGKKVEYAESVDKEITFDQPSFQSILKKSVERKERYKKTLEGTNDIFRLKQTKTDVPLFESGL